MKIQRLLLPLVLLVSSAVAGAQGDARPAIAEYNLEKGGLALEGRDPVSYFEAGAKKPSKGDKALTETHRGVTYRFANEANRELFRATPERFEPAYGGWCAYAMAQGKQVEVDVDSFRIESGRLLVFYKGFLNDTRKKWKEEGDLTPKADAAWKRISGEEPATPKLNLGPDGLALGGFDPVSYFPEGGGRPLAGSTEFTARHGGALYRFASEENRAAFLESPARFEPAYGGWCAYGIAIEQFFPVEPTSFVIQDDRLLLFLKNDEVDALELWNADPPKLLKTADANWPKLSR